MNESEFLCVFVLIIYFIMFFIFLSFFYLFLSLFGINIILQEAIERIPRDS